MAEYNGTLILLRGLPGSGKSTLARLLAEDGDYPVFSVDQYFTRADGAYVFDYSKNHLAYDSCLNHTQQAMEKGIRKIFLDNTFTMDWEMEPYFRLAGKFGYRVAVCTVENYHGGGNVHGISEEQLRKMAEKYKVKLLPS